MSAMGGTFTDWLVLDLFAGSGALGLECLSRGARHVTFVEKAHSSLRVLRRNVATLETGDRVSIVQADVFAWLDRTATEGTGRPDAAVADPPYGKGLAALLVERFAEAPFAYALWVEHATGESIPAVPGIRHRRYGDTTLTHLQAPS
jgi:16S rRNA (guanine966-N2)-methyltransferase